MLNAKFRITSKNLQPNFNQCFIVTLCVGGHFVPEGLLPLQTGTLLSGDCCSQVHKITFDQWNSNKLTIGLTNMTIQDTVPFYN